MSSILDSLFGRPFDKSKALATLRAQKIVRAVAHFSGGGDEGGMSGADLVYADGTEKQLGYDDYTWEDKEYDQERRTWVPTTKLTPEQKATNDLWEALEAPIQAEYGSFAGEFYVEGQVIFDVAAGTVVMQKNERSGYEYSEERW